MPIKCSYDKNGGVILIGTGTLLAKDILEVNRSIYATHEKIKKIPYQICDYTKVEKVKIESEELIKIAEQDNEAALVNPGMIIAVAAKKDLTFGLSRVWEAHINTSIEKLHVFRTVQECEEWIESKQNIDRS